MFANTLILMPLFVDLLLCSKRLPKSPIKTSKHPREQHVTQSYNEKRQRVSNKAVRQRLGFLSFGTMHLSWSNPKNSDMHLNMACVGFISAPPWLAPS